MLKCLSDGVIEVTVPQRFGLDTMYGFIRTAITDQGDARASTVNIDFHRLEFIEPVGVVVLSNFIEYLRRCGVGGTLSSLFHQQKAVRYLDDCGFFARYHGRPLQAHAARRPHTYPLTLVSNDEAMGFLYARLVPWIALTLEVPEHALGSIRACLEEILHNIRDHSGMMVGCVHAQFWPASGELHIAISDFGRGIPNLVRTKVPQASDKEALILACKEGFTTKSNVQNRGAGLPVLLNCVTGKDRGAVWVISGRANISATHVAGISKRIARDKSHVYPGTLVRIVLKTDRLQDWIDEVEPEVFTWN